MNKVALSSLVAVSLSVFASMANAQVCPPGSILCGGVRVGGGIAVGGSLGFGASVGVGVAPAPVQVVPTQMVPVPPPAEAVVVVQAPPPPPVYYAPPPPPPQQVVVVQQQPEIVYTTTTTYQTYGFTGRQQVGLGAFAAGLAFGGREGERGAGIGGVGATLRYRYSPHMATEFNIAGLGGRDYNGDDRAEVPVTVNQIFYLNPQNRLQLYGLIGLGGSFAAVNYNGDNARERGRDTAGYGYFGGQAGIGLEWQLSRSFSLFTDVRGFVRARVDAEAESNPEYRRVQGGRVETTNTSVGMMGSFGALFYF